VREPINYAPNKQRALAWIGAPRSMKMGTIVSPWRYDAAPDHAPRSANLRRPTIARSASAAFPISQGGPDTLR